MCRRRQRFLPADSLCLHADTANLLATILCKTDGSDIAVTTKKEILHYLRYAHV
jgi:hypothetical protein